MIEDFIEGLEEEFTSNTIIHEFDEVTMVVDKSELESTCQKLRDYFGFEMLIDLCGLDFLTYGESEWTVMPAHQALEGLENPILQKILILRDSLLLIICYQLIKIKDLG